MQPRPELGAETSPAPSKLPRLYPAFHVALAVITMATAKRW
jgi:hypothetical protein